MGQDGVPKNAIGLVHFSTSNNIFSPTRAGVAAWSFAGAGLAPLVHKASYGLADTIDELLTCPYCQDFTIVQQDQCDLGQLLGSEECPGATGLIRLGGMGLMSPVKCSWEFEFMPYVEFEVKEFCPLSNGDVLEFCWDAYIAGGQFEYSYRQCRNFTTLSPPPSSFHSQAPCRVTLFAKSVFQVHADSSAQPAWRSMDPSENRVQLLYVSVRKDRLKNADLNVEKWQELPKFEINSRAMTSAQTNPLLRVSVSNTHGSSSHIPCSLNHQDYSDFSSIAVGPKDSSSWVLDGAWTGTCALLYSDVECQVDVLFFGHSSLQITITGCDPGVLGVPQVQTAVWSFADQKIRAGLAQSFPRARCLYRRFHLTYTTAAEGSASPSKMQCTASLAWPKDVKFEDLENVILNILPDYLTSQTPQYPGAKIFSSHTQDS